MDEGETDEKEVVDVEGRTNGMDIVFDASFKD